LFPFFAVGAIQFWRARLRLEIVLVAFVVVLHSLLRAFGLFGSAGYPRYLVTVAPVLGALSARGLDGLAEAWSAARAGARRAWVRPAMAAAVTVVQLTTIVLWPHSGPVRGDAVCQMLRAVWPWCERHLAANPGVRFVADHPFFYAIGDLDRARSGLGFQKHHVEYADEGWVAVWETKFAARYSTLRDPAELVALGFERVPKEEVAGPPPYPWDGPPPRYGDPELEDFRWDVFIKRR
jgi:hypothetical protein